MTFQYVPFEIFNMKGYDLSIDTFWYIQIEGLLPFNNYLLVYILQHIMYIHIYTTQNKLET